MKTILTVRRLIWPAALVLLAVWILTGCTAMVPSPHGEIDSGSAVRMYTQFPVYDRTIDRIQVILENGGETSLEYGTEWAVEKKQGDAWVQIPFIPDAAWTQPLLMLSPGGTDSFYVSMDMLDHTMKNGQYRVVKEVSDVMYAAEFSIGESDVSVDSPFGYMPLEELPEGYSTEDAMQDGVVILLPDGTVANRERLIQFLTDTTQYIDTQIRFGSYSTQAPESLILEDVILEKSSGHTPRFTYRMDLHRAAPDNKDKTDIETKYFSYIQWHESDNGNLYLANNSKESENRELLIVPSHAYTSASEFPETVQEYFNTRIYPVSAWSPDGLRHVWTSMDLPVHFYVNIYYPNGGSVGYTVDLLSEKIPQSVKEFVWIDETTLFIVCSTNENGLEYFATYDTDKQKLTHWSTGKNGYTWQDGDIVIPD